MKFLKQDNISWKIDHSMENYTSENVLKLTLNGLKKDK